MQFSQESLSLCDSGLVDDDDNNNNKLFDRKKSFNF